MSGYAKAYRSTHPDVLARIEEWIAEEKDQAKKRKALANWLRRGGHLGKNNNLVITGDGWGRSKQPVGIEDYRNPIPEGWKRVNRHIGPDYLAPLKKHPVGKEIAARFDAIKGVEDPRNRLPGFKSSFCKPGLEVIAGAAYLLFGASTGGVAEEPFWREIKVSVYYAAKEASEVEA